MTLFHYLRYPLAACAYLVGIKSFHGRNIFEFNNLNSGNISKTCACAVQARLRGDRKQTAPLHLPPRSVTILDQGQKPESARSEAGSRRGLGPMKRRNYLNSFP